MKRYERSERMQERLQASLAGLEELSLLRDRQFSQVSEAKSMMDMSRRRRSVDAGFMAMLGHYPEFQTNSVPCLAEPEPEAEGVHDTETDVAAKVQEWLRGSHSAGVPHGAPEKTSAGLGASLDCVDGSPRILSSNLAQARRHSVNVPYHQSSSPINKRRFSVDAGPYGGLLPSKFNVQTLSRKSGSSSSTEPIDETPTSLAESERTDSPHERGDSPLENELSQVSGYSQMSPYRRFSVDAGDLRPSPPPALTSLQRRHSLATQSPLRPQLSRASVSTGALNDQKNFTLPYKLQGCRTVFNFPSPMHAVLLNSKQAVQGKTDAEPVENLSRSSEDVQEHLCEILRKPVMEVPPVPTQTGSRRGSRDYIWLRQISEESDEVTAQSVVTKTKSVASDVTSNDGTTSTVHDDVRCNNDNSSPDYIDVTSMTSPRYDVADQTPILRTSTPVEERQPQRETSPPSEQKLKRFSIRSDTDSGFAGSCMSLSTNSSHSSYSRRYHPSAWSFSSNDSDAFAADFSQGSRLSCVSSAHESYFHEDCSDDERSRKPSSIETIPEITENARDVDGNRANRLEPSSDASPPPIPPPRRRLADNSRNRRAQSAYELRSTVQNFKTTAPSLEKDIFVDTNSVYEEPPVPPPRRKLQSQRRSEYYGGARPKSYKQNDYRSSSGTIV